MEKLPSKLQEKTFSQIRMAIGMWDRRTDYATRCGHRDQWLEAQIDRTPRRGGILLKCGTNGVYPTVPAIVIHISQDIAFEPAPGLLPALLAERDK